MNWPMWSSVMVGQDVLSFFYYIDVNLSWNNQIAVNIVSFVLHNTIIITRKSPQRRLSLLCSYSVVLMIIFGLYENINKTKSRQFVDFMTWQSIVYEIRTRLRDRSI